MRKMAVMLAAGMLMTGTSYAGTWETDGNHWKYRNDTGDYAAGRWVQDEGTWYYLDELGLMKTGWHQEGDHWYYLNDSGAMASGAAQNIDGTSYTFDESGVWIPDALHGWSGNTFTNSLLDYQVTVPDGFINLEKFVSPSKQSGEVQLDFAASAPDMTVEMTVMILNLPPESFDITAEEVAQNIRFVDDVMYRLNGDVSTVVLGGYEYAKLPMVIQGMLKYDAYFRKTEQSLVYLAIVYEPGHQQMAEGILASMKRP